MTRYILPRINFLFILMAGIICLILQSTAFAIFFRSIRPDLLLVIIVYIALNRYALEGGVLALILGYIAELHSGVPSGLMMTIYIWLFVAAKLIGLGIFLTRIWTVLILVAGISLLEVILLWFLSWMLLPSSAAFWPMLGHWIPSMLLQLLAVPLMFGFFTWLDDICGKERPAKITGALGVSEFSA